MHLRTPCLPLTRPWHEERLILVPALEAMRLRRERGFKEVSGVRAEALVADLGQRDMPSVRAFMADQHLSPFPLDQCDDWELESLLRRLLQTRDLVVLDESHGLVTNVVDATTEQRRLVRAIEAEVRRMTFGGRHYRLVADVDFARLPDRDLYEVVRHDDALRVLDGLAKQTGVETGELPELLGKAKAKLARDWRPPLQPDGLILLRRVQGPRAFTQNQEPSITPSQMKALMADWIEIEAFYEDDQEEPYTGAYRIELTDGKSTSGSFDDEGFFGKYDLAKGNCTVNLEPDVVAPPAQETAAAPVQEEGADQAQPSPPTQDSAPPSAPAAPELPAPSASQEPIELRLKLLDFMGNPLVGASVSVAGTTLTSDDDGMVEGEVVASAGALSASLPGGDIALALGALSPADSGDEAYKTRLFNMGFLWDTNVAADDDEMVIALEDFQAQYQLDVTGELDDATKAKLKEAYGC